MVNLRRCTAPLGYLDFLPTRTYESHVPLEWLILYASYGRLLPDAWIDKYGLTSSYYPRRISRAIFHLTSIITMLQISQDALLMMRNGHEKVPRQRRASSPPRSSTESGLKTSMECSSGAWRVIRALMREKSRVFLGQRGRNVMELVSTVFRSRWLDPTLRLRLDS